MRKQTCLTVLLFTLAASGFAQETRSGPATTITPRSCRHTVIYQGGIPDSFGGGPDPAFLSPALTTLLAGKPVRTYDVLGCDKAFADSFQIGKCQICETFCSAELEVTYKGCGSALDCNDTITIGQAPFSQGGVVLASGLMYPPGCPNVPVGPDVVTSTAERAKHPGPAITTTATFVKRFPLDPQKFKALCNNSKSGGFFWIDVLVQDDTIIDSMRLIVTYN